MNPSFKTRTSDEALDEHLQQLKTIVASRRLNNKLQSQLATFTEAESMPPPPPVPPPKPSMDTMSSSQRRENQHQHHQQHHNPSGTMEPMRVRSDSSATSIYVMGNEVYSSNPPTMDRKQEHRLSWVNMRRRDDGSVSGINGHSRPPITPSPQTSRSYISNITTTEMMGSSTDGRSIGRRAGGADGGLGGGTISGRTTATSGQMSSSGVTTISGSNNTLNDIHSDYHSQEVGGSRDFHNFSRIGTSPTKQHNYSANGSFNLANGSTVKLIAHTDDESNQQVSPNLYLEIKRSEKIH